MKRKKDFIWQKLHLTVVSRFRITVLPNRILQLTATQYNDSIGSPSRDKVMCNSISEEEFTCHAEAWRS
jgi:hypothetical protein